MLIYHTIYAYMYKKEMKHYENGLEFQWFYQGFKNIFCFVHKEKIFI